MGIDTGFGGAAGGATTGGLVGGPIGAAIGGGIGFLGGLFGGNSTNKANKEIAAMNIAMQRETNAQNELLMRESWGRDDNAIQRRAKDLTAAGMSPLLAAGAAASNSGVVSMSAPQSRQVVQRSGLEGAISGLYQGVMAQQSMMDMMARQLQVAINQGSLGLHMREQDNRDMQAALQRELTGIGLKYEDKTKLANLAKVELQNEVDNYNLKYSKDKDLRTTDQQDQQIKKLEQIVDRISDTFKGLNFVEELTKRAKGGKL